MALLFIGLLLGLLCGALAGAAGLYLWLHRRGALRSPALGGATSGASGPPDLDELAAADWEDAAHRRAQLAAASAHDALSPVLIPLTRSLEALDAKVSAIERDRIRSHAGLTEQVVTMQRTSRLLAEETHRLSGALRSTTVRGRWGEMQLQRVVELSGMREYVDFDLQPTLRGAEGTARPDLVVRLAGRRSIVVDAKAPLDSYLRALEASEVGDEGAEAAELDNLAHALRRHIEELAHRKYWEALEAQGVESPRCVVMFIPGDGILDAALRADPTLLDQGLGRDVVLATPATLMLVLRTAALTWRAEAADRDTAEIRRLGRELHDRIASVAKHLTTLGSRLDAAVGAYNSALGSLDSRVLVTARRLADTSALGATPGAGTHGVGKGNDVEHLSVPTVTATPRPVPSWEDH